jgi:hypothetical protein
MNQHVGRRKFLGLLAASPAAAKAAAEEITAQAVRQAAMMASDAGVPRVRGYGPIGLASSGGGLDPWDKLRNWTNAEILAGRIPDHRMKELRGAAPYQARFCDDANVEGLLSVSRAHKKHMHIESALRRMIRDEKRNAEECTLWDALMKKFGG